jgi:RNA polymerase sigma-70 factor (ECF subfamily)
MATHADPDTILMFSLREGDRTALSRLFERNHARVHALCARLAGPAEAEDLVQETFLRVQRHAETFDGGSGFTPWLFRIARNVCNDRGRRIRRTGGLEAEWAREQTVSRMTPDHEGRIDRRRLIEDALAALSADDREVIVLSRMHDLPYSQIADVLGCTAGAARVRLHRAIARLRQICTELEGSHA